MAWSHLLGLLTERYQKERKGFILCGQRSSSSQKQTDNHKVDKVDKATTNEKTHAN